MCVKKSVLNYLTLKIIQVLCLCSVSDEKVLGEFKA